MKRIIKFYKDNKKTLITLFIFTILVYGYAGLNLIVNVDGIDDLMIANKPSYYEIYFSQGRWAWGMLEYLFAEYPIPFLSLILNSILFPLAGMFLGKVLNVKNDIYVILLSMIMIAFPTNILCYTYLCWQQVISIGYLCSIYAVYKMKNYNNYKDLLITSFLISFSTGIYQSFLPLIMTLTVVTFILDLHYNKSIKVFFKKLLICLLMGLFGCMLYFILVKLSIKLLNIDLEGYQGAASMFNFDLNIIISSFGTSFISSLAINFGSFTPTYIKFLLMLIFIISIILYLSKIKQEYYLLYCILIILLLILPNFLMFLLPTSFYHVLTKQAYSMLFIGGFSLLIIAIEEIKQIKIKNILNKLFIIVFSFINCVLLVNANQVFVMSKQVTESSFSYLNRLQTKIEMLDGYNNLPKVKKYYLYNDCLMCTKQYPFSDYAYIQEFGVTTSFLIYTCDVIPAFNVLGENVVLAEPTQEELIEIKSIVDQNRKNNDEKQVFIYKDIVVILGE